MDQEIIHQRDRTGFGEESQKEKKKMWWIPRRCGGSLGWLVDFGFVVSNPPFLIQTSFLLVRILYVHVMWTCMVYKRPNSPFFCFADRCLKLGKQTDPEWEGSPGRVLLWGVGLWGRSPSTGHNQRLRLWPDKIILCLHLWTFPPLDDLRGKERRNTMKERKPQILTLKVTCNIGGLVQKNNSSRRKFKHFYEHFQWTFI